MAEIIAVNSMHCIFIEIFSVCFWLSLSLKMKWIAIVTPVFCVLVLCPSICRLLRRQDLKINCHDDGFHCSRSCQLKFNIKSYGRVELFGNILSTGAPYRNYSPICDVQSTTMNLIRCNGNLLVDKKLALVLVIFCIFVSSPIEVMYVTHIHEHFFTMVRLLLV